MGVIKEGKVSGTLPGQEAFAVHYPGYPSTTARAIETLGGTEGILKARSSESIRLELRFRPEDPFSHPAFGELRQSNNLLLRISKRKSCDDPSARVSGRILEATTLENSNQSSQPEDGSITIGKEVEAEIPKQDRSSLCADIVALVSQAYHFDGMADYQHVLAVHADVARRRKRKWAEVKEPLFEKGDFMDCDQDDLMMILPPLFALKDAPENLVLRPSTTVSSRKKLEGVVQSGSEMSIELGLAIDFNIREIPKKVNWEEFIPQSSEQWEWQMAVSKLFEERPIWPKKSVTERLHDKGLTFNHTMIKRLLLGVAYYFSNGPFLRFWIKKGYDPRNDPDSRIYQKTDFRVPEPLRDHLDAHAVDESSHRWEDICSFQVFPKKFQTVLQFFELDDEYIQQEIRKPPKQTSCDSKTGWFSESMLDCLRLRVAVRFLSVYPKTGAESLLKAFSDEFEKLRRTCIFKGVLNPDQDEQLLTNKGNEDKERPKTFNGEEEEEVEADDEDEELDAYETLDLAGGDNEISLQQDSYIDPENNSITYLQELFGSFPAAAAANIHDAGTSDGEYQIYEEDSDNNDSDDDDDDD